ncbi:MAG: ATP synthase F1 subunit epsilon [Solobacterium sp.]|nr:ATP synthase F1 subunit epsilon [Solobacterium sp.]MCH4265827.1 ATP synthase F1 subunit epsilon [Solobacterium sp.]
MSTIHCRIVTPQGVYREMDASIINIEAEGGQQGILPEHMPLVTMLKIGKLTTEEKEGRREYAIAGGLFYFRDNKADILTDAIESKEDIDESRAEAARQRAEERIGSKDPNVDLKRAQVALDKAINRINVKSH